MTKKPRKLASLNTLSEGMHRRTSVDIGGDGKSIVRGLARNVCESVGP